MFNPDNAPHEMDSRLALLREIPPLMPQYLRKRLAGLPAAAEIAESMGIDRTDLFSLVYLDLACASYHLTPVTRAQLREYSPYNAIDVIEQLLLSPMQKGLIKEDANGAFFLSTVGREAVARLHRGANAYLAAQEPLPREELEKLAHELERATAALLNDPALSPGPGRHLGASLGLHRFAGHSAMEQIDGALHDLWWARDDAHIQAWRDAGLDGPPAAVLTNVWSGEATTLHDLEKALAHKQTPADVESSVTYLVERDLLVREGDRLSLTPAGALLREDIERETDRIYFTPWPHTEEEVLWLRDTLRALVDNLRPHPG